MNIRVASRWLPRPIVSPPPALPPTSPLLQIRHRSWFFFGKKDEPPPTPTLTPPAPTPTPTLTPTPTPTPAPTAAAPPILERGNLAGDTLFNEELMTDGFPATPTINPLLLDPDRRKWTWPKRADAREHRRRGRLTKKELLLRTEKAHTAKSHFFKTSLKKLGPLARQIAGKNIDEAIVQMRFSPKKAAGDVLGHLKHARNEAMLHRSMDPKVTYIEQAWVGRGTYEHEPSHRAKGRIDQLWLPYTSITVVLKEEVTRQRIAAEKEAKALRKKPWVQLPSRPIYGQTQYYRW